MANGERCYQILRGRLYQRLPLLALPLGLLEWREGGAPGTDGTFSMRRKRGCMRR